MQGVIDDVLNKCTLYSSNSRVWSGRNTFLETVLGRTILGLWKITVVPPCAEIQVERAV
jgi:hypothetical protein